MIRFCAFLLLTASWVQSAAPLDFAKDVLPILERNCLPCHNATQSEGELNMETPQLMLKGGESGPSIVVHKAMESLLYQSAAKVKKPFMPPADNKSKAQPLTSLQLELLRRWIDEGAVGQGKMREAPKWQPMPGAVVGVTAVAASEDGELIAVARAAKVTIYDLKAKQVVMALPEDAHCDAVSSLAFSPDALTLATGSFGEVKLWQRAAPIMTTERELMAKRLNAEHEIMAATFEFTYQQEEQKKTEARLKTFEEEAKKSATEHAGLVKRKVEIKKGVADAETKLAEKRMERIKADADAEAALAAQLKAEAVQKASTSNDAKVPESLKKQAEEAKKSADEATKTQKKVAQEFNEAMKALSEAKSEVGKSIDAERTAQKAADDVAETKTKLEIIKKALADAQMMRDAADKAFTLLRDVKAAGAEVEPPAKWDLKLTLGDSTKANSPLTDRVNAIAFSPQGKLLATGSGDPSRSGEIKLWDVTSGKLVREFAKPHKDAVLCLDYSDDGKWLASGSADRAVRVWNVMDGKLLRSLEAHSNHVLGVSLRHDARMLASASADASVKTWSMATGDVVTTFADFKKEVTGVSFIGFKNELMGAAGDPAVWVVKDEGGSVRRDTTSCPSYLTCSFATADGKVQMVGDAKGKVFVFDMDGKLLGQW